ncbi:MAG: mercury transporter [Alphaproteobacteria bacterium]|nr:MAG: mercury transporter [Alphaproteobacteria bacterium]
MRNSLTSLEGVNEVEVDLDEKTAVVIYETAKIDITKMTQATTEVGFPSSLKMVTN